MRIKCHFQRLKKTRKDRSRYRAQHCLSRSGTNSPLTPVSRRVGRPPRRKVVTEARQTARKVIYCGCCKRSRKGTSTDGQGTGRGNRIQARSAPRNDRRRGASVSPERRSSPSTQE